MNYLSSFITQYINKTNSSKSYTQNARQILADSRANAGFRPSIKEMLYPIVATEARGAYFTDLDGNRFLDITMGYGALLFGHAYEPLTTALQEQLAKGIQIGPQNQKAAEVANKLAKWVGLDRVAFCNSGTEANMLAFRLVRLKSGKNKIIIFENSYHGSYDATLVAPGETLGQSKPLYGGLPESIYADIIVLPYDNEISLQYIEEHRDDIAGVIIEPVRSRIPEHQPFQFLQQLRAVTQKHNIALIFDEVVTGFRCHLGGAQCYFDVKADIATYGKIIGGGLPIGIVAGSKDYLDGIDGGYWQYGDRSYPKIETTFFGGTFFKNALSVTAAHTILSELERLGPLFQERLNADTQSLAQEINAFCKSNDFPLEVVYFSSLFRFKFKGNFEIFFYALLYHGVYIWEGRNCFLSYAHHREEIEFLKDAIIKSILLVKSLTRLNTLTL